MLFFLSDYPVTYSRQKSKRIIDKKHSNVISYKGFIKLKFTIVLIQRDMISSLSNFKILQKTNHMPKTKFLVVFYMDNHEWPFK